MQPVEHNLSTLSLSLSLSLSHTHTLSLLFNLSLIFILITVSDMQWMKECIGQFTQYTMSSNIASDAWYEASTVLCFWFVAFNNQVSYNN